MPRDAHDPDDLGEPEDLLEPDAAAAGDARPGHPAAYAANWRTVLAVDAAMGVAVLVAGVIAAIVWQPLLGGFLGSLGLVYVVIVLRRGREWAAWRRAAGLPM